MKRALSKGIVIISIIVLIVGVAVVGINVYSCRGGNILDVFKKEFTSIEDVEKFVNSNYYNKDGTPKLEIWEEEFKNQTSSNINLVVPEKITGFDVQFITDEEGKSSWFLVEFLPIGSGNIIGSTNRKWISFSLGMSIYEELCISKDNRYIRNAFPPTPCKMYNGYIISLKVDQYLNNGVTEVNDKNIILYTQYYDYETKRMQWILRSELENEGGNTNEN